jgi:hypothetical protein
MRIHGKSEGATGLQSKVARTAQSGVSIPAPERSHQEKCPDKTAGAADEIAFVLDPPVDKITRVSQDGMLRERFTFRRLMVVISGLVHGQKFGE